MIGDECYLRRPPQLFMPSIQNATKSEQKLEMLVKIIEIV